jgi:hypothetical protein
MSVDRNGGKQTHLVDSYSLWVSNCASDSPLLHQPWYATFSPVLCLFAGFVDRSQIMKSTVCYNS